MIKRTCILVCLVVAMLLIPGSAIAQTYYFSLDREIVNVFINDDGTLSIDYVFVFTNDSFASPIDFVDVGTPNRYFETSSIYADVDGKPISYIDPNDYQGDGTGFAVGLEDLAIQPGVSGTVHVYIGTIRRVLYPDSQDSNYTSMVFSPTWLSAEFLSGYTDLTVTYHFPQGVQPEEPRWHSAPSGWQSEPTTGFDDQGRITYSWNNPSANGYTQYKFGASFPKQYIPADAIYKPGLLETLGLSSDDLIGILFCCGFGVFIVVSVTLSIRSTKKRKLQYLPPKIAIEGHGIKRGLTAIEAAILMEQPMDKILTMILFAVVKKGAAVVKNRDPLQIDVIDTLTEDLYSYETDFLAAFKKTKPEARRIALQAMMVDLVKSVSNKMKGFSRKETIQYYEGIINRAWSQVEAADTPEVKSEKYNEVMEWTMLDRDYDDRTRRVFTGGPIYVPIWWPRYDPTYTPRPATSSVPAPSTGTGGGLSLPHLPGSDFAASMVNSVQSFSSSVVGNLTDFTSKITSKTNPAPVSTSRSFRSSGGGGGGGCACACACAGCACACAGGGR